MADLLQDQKKSNFTERVNWSKLVVTVTQPSSLIERDFSMTGCPTVKPLKTDKVVYKPTRLAMNNTISDTYLALGAIISSK